VTGPSDVSRTARIVAWSRVGALILLAAAATGCGDKADDLSHLTNCLRGHDARVISEPASTAKLVRAKGWQIRSVDIRRNRLTIVMTRTDAASEKTLTGLLRARAAVDPARPAAHRSGKLVYWWANMPSSKERALLQRCLRS
jgi:hypothetical protein